MSSHAAPTLSDPRLSKDANLFMYEPRSADAVAHYNRNEIVADLLSFYNFLPHVSTSTIDIAPRRGWPEITEASLALHSIYKSPEAIDLLRHLPYISGREPWMLVTALVCDYRCVTVSPDAREKPGWLYNAALKQWPAWTVQVTDGTDREGHAYILDTTDGTVSRYCCTSHGQYPPTYSTDDARSWRDRYTDPETLTLREWLGHWRGEYVKMTVLTIPPDYGTYGAPDTKFGKIDAEPEEYNHEEMHVSLSRNLYKSAELRVDGIDACFRKCVKYMPSTDGRTLRNIGKKIVSKRSNCGTNFLKQGRLSRCRVRRGCTGNDKEWFFLTLSPARIEARYGQLEKQT
jgi:hypothetical protein